MRQLRALGAVRPAPRRVVGGLHVVLADREELFGERLGQLAGLGADQRGVDAVAGKGAEGRERGEDVVLLAFG